MHALNLMWTDPNSSNAWCVTVHIHSLHLDDSIGDTYTVRQNVWATICCLLPKHQVKFKFFVRSQRLKFEVSHYCSKFKYKMIEITCNDRLGKKVRVKCNPDDTIGDLKKLIAAQIGTKYDKIILKKWYRIYNDNVTLADCKYISTIKFEWN